MANDDGQSALQEAEALWAGLEPVLTATLGPEVVERMRAIANQPNLLATAPATFQARLAEALAGATPSDPDPQALLQFLAPTMAAARDLAVSRARDDEAALQHPAGAALLGFLRDCEEAMPGSVAAVSGPVLAIPYDRFPKPGLANPITDEWARTFEVNAGRTVTQWTHLLEAWYRPMLAAALTLSRQLSGNPKKVPNTVGALLERCREEWNASGGPLAVLDDDLRIVRNAESHSGVRFDVTSQTVTFVNEKPSGSVETLGPWSGEELSRRAGEFIRVCIAMWTAFYVAAGG